MGYNLFLGDGVEPPIKLDLFYTEPFIFPIHEIERYDGNPLSIANLDIQPTLSNKLNKLKRQSPEAYFYWSKTSELLK